MTLNLNNKVGIVTGGASGIGAAVVRRLLHEGAYVLAIDRDSDMLKRLSASCSNDALKIVSSDVTSQAEVREAVETCFTAFDRLDFCVCAAGAMHTAAPIHELPLSDFRRIIDINLVGTFLAIQAAAAKMIRAGHGGAIVNIGSTGSLRAAANIGAYAASKFGVAALTQSAALELAGFDIRVNAVCPGVTDTPLFRAIVGPAEDQHSPARLLQNKIPMRRLANAEEIANAVVWLLSSEAAYITGSLLPVDGGLLLS